MKRRKFVQKALSSSLLTLPFFNTAAGKTFLDITDSQPSALADNSRDEEFWYHIKQAYTTSPTLLNLNNGGVSPQPLVVQQAVEHYNRLSNQAPSYYMWRVLDKGREPIREQLASLAACSAEEIAIQRNTSEALETIIFGLRLNKGDEIVLSHYDYPHIKNAWKQRAFRDGIVLKWVDLEFPIEDTNYAVSQYEAAFTAKTKVVQLTHVINWCGQVMPVKAIATAAKKIGAEVVIDGAHSFAHLDFNIPDLGGDYFGTSLHKWLCAPFGSGMLYVKKSKIKNLFPLFAAPNPEATDIRKFEHLGTRSFAIEQAIGQAITFHNRIGQERKTERLHYLKNYWAKQFIKHPKVQFYTSMSSEWSGAICFMGIKDTPAKNIDDFLMSRQIHTVPIVFKSLNGIRVTPNVYTLTSDLDRFVEALHDFLDKR